MLRGLLGLFPDALLRCPPAIAAACAIGGFVLWIIGARFSRSLLALGGVALGASIGMRLPKWCGWQIDGMGLAIGSAIVLGTCAYLFHRTCIGLLLGAGLMIWSGAATWLAMAGDLYWDCKSVHWNGDVVQLLRDTWQTLPPTLAHVFPFACLIGFASGVTLAVFLPKLSKVLAHSLIGLTLMVVMGSIGLLTTHPDWVLKPIASYGVQGGLLIALVLVGAVWQWRITPPHRDHPTNGAKES